MNPHIRDLQTALGFTGRDVDGLRGPKTNAALLAAADAGILAVTVKDIVLAPKPSQVPAAATAKAILQGSAKYPVNEIIVHCSATASTWMEGRPLADKVAEIRRWHTSAPNNWNDIGYHWIIDRDGRVAPGRAENVIGAHTGQQNKNRGTIGICLLGGLGSTERDPFSKNFTAAQDAALRKLISEISARTTIKTVSGHNQYAARACPGFNVPTWFKGA